MALTHGRLSEGRDTHAGGDDELSDGVVSAAGVPATYPVYEILSSTGAFECVVQLHRERTTPRERCPPTLSRDPFSIREGARGE